MDGTGNGAVAELMSRAVSAALAAGDGYREIRDAASDTAVRLAIDAASGNLTDASRRLGVTVRKLQLWRAGQVPSTM